jgi:hypothetical protein
VISSGRRVSPAKAEGERDGVRASARRKAGGDRARSRRSRTSVFVLDGERDDRAERAQVRVEREPGRHVVPRRGVDPAQQTRRRVRGRVGERGDHGDVHARRRERVAAAGDAAATRGGGARRGGGCRRHRERRLHGGVHDVVAHERLDLAPERRVREVQRVHPREPQREANLLVRRRAERGCLHERLEERADAGDRRRVFVRGRRDVLARDAKRVLAPRLAVGRDDGDGSAGRAR